MARFCKFYSMTPAQVRAMSVPEYLNFTEYMHAYEKRNPHGQ